MVTTTITYDDEKEGGMTKLESKLPETYNGVDEIIATLLDNPKDTQVAIVLFKTSKITTDTDTSIQEPTIKIKRIEPIFGDDKKLVEDIYFRVYEARVGVDALPFDEEENVLNNGTDQLSLDEVALPPIIPTHTAKYLNFEGKEVTLKIAEAGTKDDEQAWMDIDTKLVHRASTLKDIKAIKKRAIKAVPDAGFAEATNE